MKQVPCFSDCESLWTENASDCHCSERYDAGREDAEAAKYDAWRDRD